MVIGSALTVVLSLVGAAADGAAGTMIGAAAASWIGALLFWKQLHTALRESARSPAESGSVPAGTAPSLRHAADGAEGNLG